MITLELKNIPFLNFDLIKNNSTLLLKVLGVLFTSLVFFSQDLYIAFSDAIFSETTSYILIIPILLVFILYRKRKILQVMIHKPRIKSFKFFSYDEIIGSSILLISIILYFVSSYSFSPLTYHLLIFPFFVSGSIIFLFNIQTLRELLFCIILLVLIVPLPAEIIYWIGSLMSSNNTNISVIILSAIGVPVSLGTNYGTPSILLIKEGTVTPFTVDIACSGIYSQLGFLIFAAFFAYIIRGKLWKKAVLLLIGFGIIYFLNVFRIIITVIIGYFGGINLALDIFHIFGGWILIFLGTLGLFFVAEKIIKLKIINNSINTPKLSNFLCGNKIDKFCKYCKSLIINGKSIQLIDALKVFGLIIAILLLLNIQAPVFAITKGPAEINLDNYQGSQITTEIWPEIQDYNLVFLQRDYAFEAVAGQEAALKYAYYPLNSTKKPIYTYLEVSSATTSLHGWEYCLIENPINQGKEPQVVKIEGKDIEIFENPPIIGRYFVFQNNTNNQIQAVLYWYETSSLTIDSTTQQRRIKISIIQTNLENNSEELISQTEKDLLFFGQEISSYWQPIRTWEKLTLIVSKTGINLVWLPIIIITITSGYEINNFYKRRKNNQKIVNKLAPENKLILNSFNPKNETSTLCQILSNYNNQTKNHLNKEQIYSKLKKMADIGLVSEKIINIEDEPTFSWIKNL